MTFPVFYVNLFLKKIEQKMTKKIDKKQINPTPETAPTNELDNAEADLSSAALELLTGIQTNAEEEVFLQEIGEYRDELSESVSAEIDKLVKSGEQDSKIRERIIELLLESKMDVISSASYQHSAESLVERLKDTLSKTKTRRVIGAGVVALSMGVGAYMAAKGFETGLTSSGNGVLRGVAGALSAMQGPILLKTTASTLSVKIRGIGKEGLNEFDIDRTKRAYEDVAEIEDPTERELELHRILNEQHIEKARLRLYTELGRLHVGEDEGLTYDDLARIGANIVMESMADFYDVSQNESKLRKLINALHEKLTPVPLEDAPSNNEVLA